MKFNVNEFLSAGIPDPDYRPGTDVLPVDEILQTDARNQSAYARAKKAQELKNPPKTPNRGPSRRNRTPAPAESRRTMRKLAVGGIVGLVAVGVVYNIWDGKRDAQKAKEEAQRQLENDRKMYAEKVDGALEGSGLIYVPSSMTFVEGSGERMEAEVRCEDTSTVKGPVTIDFSKKTNMASIPGATQYDAHHKEIWTYAMKGSEANIDRKDEVAAFAGLICLPR